MINENIKCPCCGSEEIIIGFGYISDLDVCNTCKCAWYESKRQPPNALEAELRSRWIACSEKLPEIHTPVLVYGTYHTPHVMSLAFDGAWHQLKALEYETITHWQPLPQPPKEGE